MSDLRIQYNEEMVGAGHPTKGDTLNRLALIECDSDGHGLYRWLKNQGSDPATAAGEICLYAKSGKPYWRAPSDGAVTELGGVFKSAQFLTKAGSSDTSFTEQTQTSTITSVDTAKTIAVPQGFVGPANAYCLYAPVITGATTLSWYSQSSASLAGENMAALVLEFLSGIKSIQVVSKGIALNAGSGSTTSTISSIDPAKAWVFWLTPIMLLAGGTANVRVSITDATTITWTYNLNFYTTTAIFRCVVVEFN